MVQAEAFCYCSVPKLCLTLRLRGLQHARLHCCPVSPRVCSMSCPLSWWCYLTISSSATHFSFCLQSFPASGSFSMSRLFALGDQSTGASTSMSVLLMNIQGWFPLGLTGLLSLLSKGLSRVFSSTTVKKCQFFGAQSSLWRLYLISNFNSWCKIQCQVASTCWELCLLNGQHGKTWEYRMFPINSFPCSLPWPESHEYRKLEFASSFNKYLWRAFHVPDGDTGANKIRPFLSRSFHFYRQSQGHESPCAAITNNLTDLKHIGLLF